MKNIVTIVAPVLTVPVLLMSTAYAAPPRHAIVAQVATQRAKNENALPEAKANLNAKTPVNIKSIVRNTYRAPYRQAVVVTTEVVKSSTTPPIHVETKDVENAECTAASFMDLSTTTGSQGTSSTYIGNGVVYQNYGTWQKTGRFTMHDLSTIVNDSAKALEGARVVSVPGGHKIISKLSEADIESIAQDAVEYMGVAAAPTPQKMNMLFKDSTGTDVITTTSVHGVEVYKSDQQTIKIVVPQATQDKFNGITPPSDSKAKQNTIVITMNVKTTESYKKVSVRVPKGLN